MYTDEQLRELMLSVEVPPTTADIGRAKAAGRRNARRNRIVAGGAALLAVGGSAYFAVDSAWYSSIGRLPPGQVPTADCKVDVVELPAGDRARADAVDPTGRTIVGTLYMVQWRGNPVRFENGEIYPYRGLAGTAVAINARGLLVGYDDVDEASHTLGWTYRDGQKTMLAKLAGYPYTVPTAVNARGDVVGAAMGEGLDETTPVLWPADQPGTVRPLPLPAGYAQRNLGGSRAVGVADDGTVVGHMRGVPIRWTPNDTPSEMPVPDGYREARPEVLRGRYAYGSGTLTAENRNTALRWDLRDNSVTVLKGVPADLTDGTPAGWALTTGGDTREPTRITPEGTAEKLPRPQGGRQDVVAGSMSDDGKTIVGWTSSVNPMPVIWRC